MQCEWRFEVKKLNYHLTAEGVTVHRAVYFNMGVCSKC